MSTAAEGAGVDAEITLPGVVGGPGGSMGAPTSAPQGRINLGAGLGAVQEEASDEEEDLENIEETISERLFGLTEMLPDRAWTILGRSLRFSYWLVRRSGWVMGTSLALLAVPPFIEYQRMELEDMHSMQKKQMLLGPSQPPMSTLPGPR